MTQSYGYGSGPSSGAGTGHEAKEQATQLGQGVAQAGGRVAQTAAEQGGQVVRETGAQARNLMGEATGELRHQASMQQKRAAEGLRSLSSELRSMARSGDQQGVASELVQQAADRAHRTADWLEHREPGQVLDEVRDFARRRPGVFLAGALAVGVVVGRLTRSLVTPRDTADDAGTGAPYPARTVPVTEAPTVPLNTTAPPVAEPYPAEPMAPRATGYPGEVRP
jgi:hypothetical protein